MRIVIDDQQNAVAFLDFVAVIGQNVLRVCDREHRRGRLPERSRNTRCGPRNGARRTTIHKWQVQSESTSLSGRTLQLDFTAQQYRKLAADGATRARAAILTTGDRKSTRLNS